MRPKPSTAQQAAVIVNPVKIDAKRLRSAVAAEEKKNGWLPSVWFQTSIDDPGQLAARSALEHDPTVVIVAGGDGTIRTVAEVVYSSGIPVAVVAAGTANLLARNLGLTGDIETSVRTGFTGSARDIDVGVVNLEYHAQPAVRHVFLVMTGVGLDARMAVDTNRFLKRRIGWLAYVDPISKSVLGNEQFWMHYRLDDRPERTVRAHTAIVGNCGTLTAGILLLPDARVDDGYLDVVVLRPRGFWQWLRVGSRLGVGGILRRTRRGRVILRATPDLRALQYVQARKMTTRFDPPQPIQLDGNSFGTVAAVTITVHHRGLTIRVPNRAPHQEGKR